MRGANAIRRVGVKGGNLRVGDAAGVSLFYHGLDGCKRINRMRSGGAAASAGPTAEQIGGISSVTIRGIRGQWKRSQNLKLALTWKTAETMA